MNVEQKKHEVMGKRKITDSEFVKYVIQAYGFLVKKDGKKISGDSFSKLITCCYDNEHSRQCAKCAKDNIVWISSSPSDITTAAIRTE